MAIRYVPYFPDTLQGQAILSNFTRTRRVLTYRDHDTVIQRVRRGMPLYETELKEEVGSQTFPDKNLLIRGECVSACAYLKDKGIKIDLVYIDPPFASGADYAKRVYLRKNPRVAAAIAQAEQELDNDDLRAFEEKMYGDIWDKERYLNWMYENLTAIKSVMSETGSIYVHLDWHIGHYVKILMDEIFGEENFQNEIIWQKLKAAKKQSVTFGNVHDTLFYYTMTPDDYTHNKQFKEYDQKLINSHYSRIDENGRRYTDDSFTQSGPGPARSFGERGMLTPPPGKHWIWSQENIDEGLRNGRIIFSSTGMPRKKSYLDEREGIAVSDIWTDLFPINSQSAESEDYATQKPIALLERIIKASSKEGQLVADFFGGSGVTSLSAHRLGRHFIHVDVGINSVQTARKRLVEDKASFSVMEIRDGVSLYRNPAQTMDKLKMLIPGLRQEPSLDKFWAGAIADTQDGMVPVYLPDLKDSMTRLLDCPLMSRILHGFMPALPVETKRVIIYYIDMIDKDDMSRFIREQKTNSIEVELRDLKQVLDDAIMEDEATWRVEKTMKNHEEPWQVDILSFFSERVKTKIDEYNARGYEQYLNKMLRGDVLAFVPLSLTETGLEMIEWLSVDSSSAEKDAVWHSESEIFITRTGKVTKNGVKSTQDWDGTISSPHCPKRLKIRNICGDETVFVL